MRLRNLTAMVLILIVCMLSGCSSRTDTDEESKSIIEDEALVQIAAEPQAYNLDLRTDIDGNVSFEENRSKTVSLGFLPDGKEKSVVLEDDNGLTWELIVPAGALSESQAITMTAMSNIKSSLGDMIGGVVLSPDGLQFVEPVILSIRGRDIGKSGYIFSGNEKGEELEFSFYEINQDNVEVKLFHFSTVFAPADSTIEKLSQIAGEQRKSAEAAANKLLKMPIEAPYPPSISLKCHHNTEKQEEAVLAKFIEEFDKPEIEVLDTLLSAAKNIQLTTGELPDHKFDIELRVLDRLIKKANALIAEYNGQEEKYIAVSRAALTAEKRYQLLGGSNAGGSLLPKLAAWAKGIAEKYLKELKENHEYKNIHPILKITREAALLGADMDEYVDEELRRALMFKVEYINKMNASREWGFAFEVKGEAPMDPSMASQLSTFQGEGIGTYTSFKINGLEGGEAVMDNIAETFPLKFIIENFNPCESETFDIYMDRFGAESESITITPDEPDIPPKTTSGGGVQGANTYNFQDNKQGDLYKFTLDLKNGQKVAAEQTFTKSSERADLELMLKLIHTP